MKEASWITQAMLTALLTVVSTVLINRYTAEQARKTGLVTGAEAVSAKTISLLFESQMRLEELIHASHAKTWSQLSDSNWKDYRAFRSQWRRNMIAQYYHVKRYFGVDVANQILHVSEIANSQEFGSGSLSSSASSAKYNLLSLADDIEYEARLIAMTNQIREEANMSDALASIDSKQKLDDSIHERMRQYDLATALLLRTFNMRLDAMGKVQAIYTD